MAAAHRGRRPVRGRGAARKRRSSPRSSVTASHGTARSRASRERTASYAAALDRLRASGDAYECACSRRELETARDRTGRRARLSGNLPRRNSGGSARPSRSAPGACASAARASSSATACRARRRRTSRATSATSWSGARTGSTPTSSRSSSTTRCRKSRTSCAAPTCSRRRRARSSCSGCSALAAPSYLHVPVAINAAGEKLSKQTGAAPLPDDPLPALFAAWRFLGQRLAGPVGERRHSIAEFWSWAIAAWDPARLPPTGMLPAPARVRRRARAGRYNQRFPARRHRIAAPRIASESP